jgi:uncharacterized membrane protein
MDRLAAFSDGVFAVGITVLALGIDIPSDALLAHRDDEARPVSRC